MLHQLGLVKKQQKRRPGKGRSRSPSPAASTTGLQRWRIPAILSLLAVLGIGGVFLRFQKKAKPTEQKLTSVYVPHSIGSLTFNKDIATIVFDKCSPCHRPEQTGPFSLLTFQDVKRRAKDIRDVVESRLMPPWLPEPGVAHFAGDRSLTSEQRGMILQWLSEGMIEGRPEDLPDLPKWPEGWELGPPDLVMSLPSAYVLPAEGRDIYRNFVVPIPVLENRYVRAVEFRPGNAKVVHHAFVNVDSSRQSRYLTRGSQPPGFDGMQLPPSVQMPMGQFLGWQPGKPAMQSPEGLSWPLQKGSDLVLQLHMRPSGKPETVLPSVGFYFTEIPPTNTLYRLQLARYTIDIPPGEKDYRVENSYVLPVDVDLLRINPHTHYLGNRLEGWATLPDGTRKDLLLIKNWDFNWQGDYAYQEPIYLPKGTALAMRFSFDNSAENIRNPNQPPKRVQFGLQSSDEMAELWFQVLPRSRSDLAVLSQDAFAKFTRDSIESLKIRLQANPQDSRLHARLGSALYALGEAGEGLQHLRTAAELDPRDPLPHSQLGAIYLHQQQLSQAEKEFEAVLRSDPEDHEAYGSLGLIRMSQRRYAEAAALFEQALQINPEDKIASANLQALRAAMSRRQ